MRVNAYDLAEKRGSICQWICAHMRAGGPSSLGRSGRLSAQSHVACGCGSAQRQSAHLALVVAQHERRLQRIAEGGLLRGSAHARQQREDTLLVDEAADKVDRLTPGGRCHRPRTFCPSRRGERTLCSASGHRGGRKTPGKNPKCTPPPCCRYCGESSAGPSSVCRLASRCLSNPRHISTPVQVSARCVLR
jgi:hypothetical protein